VAVRRVIKYLPPEPGSVLSERERKWNWCGWRRRRRAISKYGSGIPPEQEPSVHSLPLSYILPKSQLWRVGRPVGWAHVISTSLRCSRPNTWTNSLSPSSLKGKGATCI
jgi:hypothetical protein